MGGAAGPGKPTAGVADCTQLLKSSDVDIVENLRVRYQADEIHTFVGSMLVVLNPYRPMLIYDTPDAFRAVRLARATPHVFAMAEEVCACVAPVLVHRPEHPSAHDQKIRESAASASRLLPLPARARCVPPALVRRTCAGYATAGATRL
jgi:hypothetical protein